MLIFKADKQDLPTWKIEASNCSITPYRLVSDSVKFSKSQPIKENDETIPQTRKKE